MYNNSSHSFRTRHWIENYREAINLLFVLRNCSWSCLNILETEETLQFRDERSSFRGASFHSAQEVNRIEIFATAFHLDSGGIVSEKRGAKHGVTMMYKEPRRNAEGGNEGRSESGRKRGGTAVENQR